VQKSAQEFENKGDRPRAGWNVGKFEGWNVERTPYPPMKMDHHQKKGVARGAFCKCMKGKGMFDGK
jgi:hypothetical protein